MHCTVKYKSEKEKEKKNANLLLFQCTKLDHILAYILSSVVKSKSLET